MLGFQYGCIATVSGLRHVPSLDTVNGDHWIGKNHNNVKVLSVIDDELNRIPTGIADFFPYLIGLQWFRGNLMEISGDDLRPFPDLRVLRIENNKLYVLDSNLFMHTPKLQWLGFGNNILQHVGLNLLSDLNDLTGAYFQKNPCIDMNAGTLEEIQELKLRLPDKCPPLSSVDPPPPTAPSTMIPSTTIPSTMIPSTTISTTTQNSGECSVGCIDKIEALEQNVFSVIEGLTREVSEQREENARQRQINTYHETRILELEKQMRERSPCSCK